MRDENIHPSDQDLLLLADGEVPERRAAEFRAHLAACWQCRARMAEIEATIADFVRAYRDSAEGELPPPAGPRALLKARLAQLAGNSSQARWQGFRLITGSRKLVSVCALGLLAILAGSVMYQRVLRPQSNVVVYAGVLPDPRLTPGVTRSVAIGDLCSIQHDEVVRPVPSILERQVLNEYGVPNTLAGNYEVDYLITPGLGGAEDIRNLWPQPHSDTTWNSHVKDQLEERLHHLVCAGQLDLTTAQREISINWIVAYKKYFGTDRPLLDFSVTQAPLAIDSWTAQSGDCPRFHELTSYPCTTHVPRLGESKASLERQTG